MTNYKRTNTYTTVGLANLLLRISSLLMTSGANTNRILLILNKFSKLLKTDAQVFINHKAFIVSLTDEETGTTMTKVMRLPGNVVNFQIISALSQTSLIAEKEQWNYNTIAAEVERIAKIKPYPKFIRLFAVSLAGAGLCYIFNGDIRSMLAAFGATFLGLFVKHFFDKHHFNPYMAAFSGALVAGLSAGAFLIVPGYNPNIAIATSVLFIIPGVPLINSFTDFLDGYIITGFVRLMNGLLYVFAIAFALFIVMYVFKIHNL